MSTKVDFENMLNQKFSNKAVTKAERKIKKPAATRKTMQLPSGWIKPKKESK